MNKENFIRDLTQSLHNHYQAIIEDESILSFGIYTDGDASTIGIYYNTEQHLQNLLQLLSKEPNETTMETHYYVFFMEEWKKDISMVLNDEILNSLSDRLYDFRSEEYDNGNENYKNEILDLFVTALIAFKNLIPKNDLHSDFFLHLEVSDSWIDEQMLERISTIHPQNRFLEYKEYVKSNNQF